MLKCQSLPNYFWSEVVICAADVTNKCPTKALSITPFEAWYDRKPFMAHFKVFGCLHILLFLLISMGSEVIKPSSVFPGYASKSKVYRLYHPPSQKIIISHNVIFVEDAFQPLVVCIRE